MQPDNASVAALLVDDVHELLAPYKSVQDGQELLQRLHLRTPPCSSLGNLRRHRACIAKRMHSVDHAGARAHMQAWCMSTWCMRTCDHGACWCQCMHAAVKPQRKWRTWKVAVRSAQCGLSRTLSRSQRGLSCGSGSVSVTSRAAPLMRFSCSAACAQIRNIFRPLAHEHPMHLPTIMTEASSEVTDAPPGLFWPGSGACKAGWLEGSRVSVASKLRATLTGINYSWMRGSSGLEKGSLLQLLFLCQSTSI